MVRVDDRRAMIQTQLMNTLQNIDETLLNEVAFGGVAQHFIHILSRYIFRLAIDVLVACLKTSKAFIVTTTIRFAMNAWL